MEYQTMEIWAAVPSLKDGLVHVIDALSGIQLHEVDPSGPTATALGALLRYDAPSGHSVVTAMLRGREVSVIDAPDEKDQEVHPDDLVRLADAKRIVDEEEDKPIPGAPYFSWKFIGGGGIALSDSGPHGPEFVAWATEDKRNDHFGCYFGAVIVRNPSTYHVRVFSCYAGGDEKDQLFERDDISTLEVAFAVAEAHLRLYLGI